MRGWQKSDQRTMERLIEFAQEHGVKMTKIERSKASKQIHAAPGVDVAPFTQNLGVRWAEKELLYVSIAQWPEVIHDLGHLLACSQEPLHSQEFDFLGWELALVYYLEASLDEWLSSNADYGATDEDGQTMELGSMHPVKLHRMLAERFKRAEELGLVDEAGNPLAIR